MEDLLALRGQIEQVDLEIVKQFEARMELVLKVAEWKYENGVEILDIKQEERKLAALEDMVCGAENKRAVRELFIKIMSISRENQNDFINRLKERR